MKTDEGQGGAVFDIFAVLILRKGLKATGTGTKVDVEVKGNGGGGPSGGGGGTKTVYRKMHPLEAGDTLKDQNLQPRHYGGGKIKKSDSKKYVTDSPTHGSGFKNKGNKGKNKHVLVAFDMDLDAWLDILKKAVPQKGSGGKPVFVKHREGAGDTLKDGEWNLGVPADVKNPDPKWQEMLDKFNENQRS